MWADDALKKARFCPFKITNEYGALRGGYSSDDEQFFIFPDGSPVTSRHIRRVLRKMVKKVDLDPKLYNTHSLRIGRASDLMKMGTPLDTIKYLGRWKSNAVLRYLK